MAQAAGKDEPSGRLLDPDREAGARGMIVAEHCCKAVHRTESGLQAHPPLICCNPVHQLTTLVIINLSNCNVFKAEGKFPQSLSPFWKVTPPGEPPKIWGEGHRAH